MDFNAVIHTDFDAFLYASGESVLELQRLEREREKIRGRFPFAVMLEASYDNQDVANRWCYQNFGPRFGECIEKYSRHPNCDIDVPHSHSGIWTSEWYEKMDYDYGFNEWYFSSQENSDQFIQFVHTMNAD